MDDQPEENVDIGAVVRFLLGLSRAETGYCLGILVAIMENRYNIDCSRIKLAIKETRRDILLNYYRGKAEMN